MNNRLTEAYISILKEELLMATGCTEPIAIAYCAAKMRDILGGEPERIEAEVSGNILKNVKSVIVPNTGGLKGINAAIAAGIIAGRAEKVLQVISYVTQEEHSRIREYMEVTPLAVSCSDNGRMLDIRLTGYRGGDSAMVHIANNHSNIIREERNGAVLMELPPSDSAEDNLQDKSVLNTGAPCSPERYSLRPLSPHGCAARSHPDPSQASLPSLLVVLPSFLCNQSIAYTK